LGGERGDYIGQPISLFIYRAVSLFHIPKSAPRFRLEPLSHRSEMVQIGFHTSDGHEPFMKSLRLDGRS